MNEIGKSLQPADAGKDEREMVVGELSAEHYFSGPLPPPAVLERYEKALPGSAERILAMAEKQSEHRRQVEQKIIHSDILDSKLGLWFGFLIGLAAVLVGGWVSVKVSTGAGGVISISAIAALVGVFVYGSRQKQNEPPEKPQPEDPPVNNMFA